MDEFVKKQFDEIKQSLANIGLCMEKIEIYNSARESCELENKPFLVIDNGWNQTNNIQSFKTEKSKERSL